MGDSKFVSVSIKMTLAEVEALDAFARTVEADLLAQGLRMAVSRAAAIRTLIERGLPSQTSERAPSDSPLTTAAEPVDSEEDRP